MATDQAPRIAPGPRRPPLPRYQAAGQRVLDRVAALGAALTERTFSLYASAVLRIGYGLLYLTYLLREFPHRDQIWGPGSPWTPALANQLFEQTGWISILTLSDSRAYFEVCYVVAIVTAALFMLGWRTRATSILFGVVVTSFHARAIYMTDGGDNLTVLMAVYLMFTACGRRWSLDSRRNRRRASAEMVHRSPLPPVVAQMWARVEPTRRVVTTVLHNCAIFVIAAQVCIVYGAAGLYKVQGSSWVNGTALHYVLNQDLFQPWPALSQIIDHNLILVTVASYLTVLLQVALPFVLFSRLKYIVLAMLIGMHVAIAVVMGLPLFSATMIIADAVFLPDRFYRYVEQTICSRRG
jgi:Vitamin K-dependent gamma-carboxylase